MDGRVSSLVGRVVVLRHECMHACMHACVRAHGWMDGLGNAPLIRSVRRVSSSCARALASYCSSSLAIRRRRIHQGGWADSALPRSPHTRTAMSFIICVRSPIKGASFLPLKTSLFSHRIGWRTFPLANYPRKRKIHPLLFLSHPIIAPPLRTEVTHFAFGYRRRTDQPNTPLGPHGEALV